MSCSATRFLLMIPSLVYLGIVPASGVFFRVCVMFGSILRR